MMMMNLQRQLPNDNDSYTFFWRTWLRFREFLPPPPSHMKRLTNLSRNCPQLNGEIIHYAQRKKKYLALMLAYNIDILASINKHPGYQDYLLI